MEPLKDITYGEATVGDVLAFSIPTHEMHMYVLLDKQSTLSQISGDFTCSTLTVLHVTQSFMGNAGEVQSYIVDNKAQTLLFHRPAC